jgi:CheY-like chemotaxis protein
MAKILIVDDDAYLRELYEEVLKAEGYDVITAVDGEDGLAKLQQGGFDLTLLDVMMPKLDGLGVLKKLHETPPTNPNKTILLLTNLAQDPIVQEALHLGVKSYLIKADITPDQLIEKVKEYVQN